MTVNLREFRKWQKKHPNIITSEIVRLHKKSNVVIELSTGTDFDHNPIFGVSQIEYKEGTFGTVPGKGKCFWDLAKAEEYVQKLLEEVEVC